VNTDTLKTELFPAAEPGSKRLMLVMHGLGDSIDGYRWFQEAMQVPWLNYLLVNAPDPYYGGFAWYDLYSNAGVGIERSRKLLFTLIDDLGKKGYKPSDIVVSGFSQGCLMSMELALHYPERFAAIVGISGYVHEPETTELSAVAKDQRILMTHGTQDPLIPIEAVRKQVATLQKRGLQIEWREFVKAHTIAGETELKVIRQFLSDKF
jgi:phospholipase/carboxylesterase